MMPTAINPHVLALAQLNALSDLQLTKHQTVVKARNYHDGEHPTFLTDRLKEFLNIGDTDTAFRLNLTRGVVMSLAERLIVTGFDCADEGVKDWAAAAWKQNEMDAQADDVHESALRDGESFVIVDWGAPQARIRLTPHPLYTSVEAGGDGFGCEIKYPDDDVSLPAEYAVKRWIETTDDIRQVSRQRATFYYPGSIEKYVYADAGWKPIVDSDGEAWPLPWVTSAGQPLGIPVIHFRNKAMRCEATDAWPLQDALNKTLIDLLASADMTAFRIFVALGFYPTSDGAALAADGSNALQIAPGQVVGTTRAANEASFTAIDPADLSQLRELKKDLTMDTAIVTNTPLSRFRQSGEVAAEGTLKQEEEPLLAKVRNRQILFGSAWEAGLDVARRIENTFGGGSLDEAVEIVATWSDAQTRTDAERQAEWKVKKELGIPRRQLWSEMGYSAEKIDEMLNDPETRALTFTQFP